MIDRFFKLVHVIDQLKVVTVHFLRRRCPAQFLLDKPCPMDIANVMCKRQRWWRWCQRFFAFQRLRLCLYAVTLVGYRDEILKVKIVNRLYSFFLRPHRQHLHPIPPVPQMPLGGSHGYWRTHSTTPAVKPPLPNPRITPRPCGNHFARS